MANFVSTTTSGYSDPLKATAIKALEARQKDMQAQIAAAQAGGITPENTQTPIQGFGHIANQLGDSFRVARVDRAAAEGRNELAGVIAQGPKGSDGNWSPEQLAVMSRRDPEFMSKLIGQQHERGNIRITEKGLGDRNDATIGGQNARSAAEITSREKISGEEQGGLNFRQNQQIGATSSDKALDRAATSQLQADRFSGEAGLERIKAAIAEASQQREFAHKSNQLDKVAGYDQQLARLNAELKARESSLDRAHQDATLNTKIAADENQIRLRADLAQAEGDRQRAAAAKQADKQLEAEERITRIKGDLAVGLEDIKARHGLTAQTQAEAATEKNVNTKVDADKAVAAANADATRNTPANVAAGLKLQRELTQKQLLEHKLERAGEALNHPEGIHTGATGRMFAEGTSWTGLGDKKKAERTILVDTAMDEVATGKMADVLVGPSTNFELQKFIDMNNNPKVSIDERRTQFATLLKAVKKDRAATAAAVTRTGGDASDPNVRPPAAGAPAPAAGAPAAGAPAAMSPAEQEAALNDARVAINKNKKDPNAVKKMLQDNGIDPKRL